MLRPLLICTCASLVPCLALGQQASEAQRTDTAASLPTASAGQSREVIIHAFLWTTTPVALKTGLVLGGGADVRRSLGESGFFVGARLAAGETSEATQDWSLTHVHMLAAAVGGYEKQVGIGLLQAQLELGVLGIRQIGKHQQYNRLAADGVAGLERNGWSFGPWLTAEVGAAVAIYDPWRLFLQLGPGLTVQRVEGSRGARFFLSASLGVSRAF